MFLHSTSVENAAAWLSKHDIENIVKQQG